MSNLADWILLNEDDTEPLIECDCDQCGTTFEGVEGDSICPDCFHELGGTNQ